MSPPSTAHSSFIIPTFFFKKSKGEIVIATVCPSVCLSVRPLCYLLLNHWTKFNQIWCVRYSHEWGVQRHFFGLSPWGPGEGSKGQISYNFNYKVNFKDFYTKLCVCTHKWKIQNIGARIKFRPAVCQLCYLLNHLMKFNQIWCVGYSHKWGVQKQNCFGPAPLRPLGGVKRSNII